MNHSIEGTALARRIRLTATELAGGPRYQMNPDTGESIELPVPLEYIGAAIALDVLRREAERENK
jgi:hypothetical protein